VATASAPGLPIGTRRVLLICGKGGVGKTTVASALALTEARRGRRVLLAGIHATDQISRYFGVPTVSLKEIELEPRLYAIHLDEQLVFDSFIRKTFRFKRIYRSILESSVYQYFTAAAPGLKELIVLDLLQNMADQGHAGRYDRIIVDCPATGHGLSYLNVGNQALKTFPIGPLRRKGEAVQRMLTNPATTGVILVTLAEEMPVNETLELHAALRERLNIAVVGVVVNALFPELGQPPETEGLERLKDAAPFFSVPELARRMAEAGLFYNARREINREHLERLGRELTSVPQVQIPFLPNEARDLNFLAQVGRHLTGASAEVP
jgi:anion-transporting  ArsA/GET3 family ATPase